VEAARGKMVQAGLYPNPTINWHADEMNNPGGRAGHQGMSVIQDIVLGHKLRLAREAAAAAVAAADWQAMTRWYDVVTRVRLAYAEVLTARREVEAQQDGVRVAEQGLATAERLNRAGIGSQPDVLRAQLELEQARVLLAASRQRVQTAWRLLGAAVGIPDLPEATAEGAIEAPVPTFDWQPTLESVLGRSSEVQEARANADQAARLLRRAEAERIPDIHTIVRPFYSDPDRNAQLLAEVGATLPLFNRNQGNIQAARADLVRTREEVRLVELKLTERLAAAFQRYQVARQQVEASQRGILPHAAESLRLVRVGYERGDPKYDYTAVLEAQRTLIRARLAYVQALGELWRAAVDIAGLLQQDDLNLGCVTR
jgi:cobalt-zinc-cadmium efflux system outer membrane protein